MTLICNSIKHDALTKESEIKVQNLMHKKIKEENSKDMHKYIKSNFKLKLLPSNKEDEYHKQKMKIVQE